MQCYNYNLFITIQIYFFFLMFVFTYILFYFYVCRLCCLWFNGYYTNSTASLFLFFFEAIFKQCITIMISKIVIIAMTWLSVCWKRKQKNLSGWKLRICDVLKKGCETPGPLLVFSEILALPAADYWDQVCFANTNLWQVSWKTYRTPALEVWSLTPVV